VKAESRRQNTMLNDPDTMTLVQTIISLSVNFTALESRL
jgi:hypothetical protein